MMNTILAEGDVRAAYAAARQCVQNASDAISWPGSRYRAEPMVPKIGDHNLDRMYLTTAFDDLRESCWGEFVANGSEVCWKRHRFALSPIIESAMAEEPIQIGERYYSTSLGAAFGEAESVIGCFVDYGDFDKYQSPCNFDSPLNYDSAIPLRLWNALKEWPSLQKLNALLDIEERKAIHAATGFGERSTRAAAATPLIAFHGKPFAQEYKAFLARIRTLSDKWDPNSERFSDVYLDAEQLCRRLISRLNEGDVESLECPYDRLRYLGPIADCLLWIWREEFGPRSITKRDAERPGPDWDEIRFDGYEDELVALLSAVECGTREENGQPQPEARPANDLPETDSLSSLRSFTKTLRGNEREIADAILESPELRFPFVDIQGRLGWLGGEEKGTFNRMRHKLKHIGWSINQKQGDVFFKTL